MNSKQAAFLVLVLWFTFGCIMLWLIFRPDDFIHHHPIPLSRSFQLMDLVSFRFLLRPAFNVPEDGRVLCLVVSAVDHGNQRQALRDALASEAVSLVFLLGSPGDAFVQSTIQEEYHRYGDILQGNFIDSYRNLTYKYVMGYKWIEEVKYEDILVKMDDDTFVDIERLVKLASNWITPHNEQPTLVCAVAWKQPVLRIPSSKWFVRRTEYANETYPPYCSGYAVVLNGLVARDLANEAQKMPYFWVDDVFMTGIVAKRLNIRHIDIKGFYTMEVGDLVQWLSDKNRIGPWFIVGPTWGDPIFLQLLYIKLQWCRRVQCSTPSLSIQQLIPTFLQWMMPNINNISRH